MKILFHEAKNADGADFDTNTPDTYKAVYAVEPVSGHPSYRISRNITVKEPETETQSESSSEIAVDDDSGTGDTEQSDDDSESHQENTVDTETELTVSEVLEQAETNGIDLYAMDAGETVTFMASAGNARSSQQVSVTRGTMYRYADYGYGSYLTYQYTVKFGNVSATAYCVQPSKPGPGSGTYTINKVGDGKALAKNDITGADGKVILEADTVIEELATDKEGKLTFTADLPIGFEYYIKETSPAPGFATTDEKQEFTFEYEGAETEKVSYAFTFEDEPTVIEITKTSLTDGKELEGAKLQVTDENGKVVDSWTSGKEAHIIKELVVGQKYILTETKPADGFVTAESITFTVGDTAEAQKIEMKDDVTKVEISKTDISGKELPGAKLTILDKDGKTVESWTSEEKPHYIEMLPIGEYTLREESAPDGYLVAEDVKFTVEDTGEIQKVVMKDEVKPEETPTSETPSTQVTDTPKTGDDTHMLLWILLAVAGMAGIVSVVWVARKKK